MSVAISNPYPYAHTEMPAGIYEPVTPADADIPGGFRALLVGTAGTATLMDMGRNVRANVPLVAGYNPIMGCRVISLGTAANIWALR